MFSKKISLLTEFIDNRFTKVYEIDLNDKLINSTYELTKSFQHYLDANQEPVSNGCKSKCSFFKQEFKGFSNKLDTTPVIKINKFYNYISLKKTFSELSKEIKGIGANTTSFIVEVQQKMIELETKVELLKQHL